MHKTKREAQNTKHKKSHLLLNFIKLSENYNSINTLWKTCQSSSNDGVLPFLAIPINKRHNFPTLVAVTITKISTTKPFLSRRQYASAYQLRWKMAKNWQVKKMSTQCHEKQRHRRCGTLLDESGLPRRRGTQLWSSAASATATSASHATNGSGRPPCNIAVISSVCIVVRQVDVLADNGVSKSCDSFISRRSTATHRGCCCCCWRWGWWSRCLHFSWNSL